MTLFDFVLVIKGSTPQLEMAMHMLTMSVCTLRLVTLALWIHEKGTSQNIKCTGDWKVAPQQEGCIVTRGLAVKLIRLISISKFSVVVCECGLLFAYMALRWTGNLSQV